MKKIALFSLLLIFTMLGTAFAAGTLVKDKSKLQTPIQSIVGLSPTPAASACTTATGTKGTIVTITPTGYSGVKWTATDAAGAAKVVKRIINSNTAFMPESGGTVTINSGITSMKFDKYSAASTTTTVCVEMQ